MSILENTKEIAELIKKMGNIDLYKRIVELEGQIINLSRDKHQLEVKLYEIEKAIEQEQDMEFRMPFYYKGEDPHPFCPKCWEANRKAIHLKGPINDQMMGTSYHCYECKNTFYL